MDIDSSPEAESDLMTPLEQTINTSILSPPDSQHGHDHQTRFTSAMPTSASGATSANANGKRPLYTISNGADDTIRTMSGNAGKAKADFPPKTHPSSGYTWARIEEEPGYAWLNKKAVDESQRAWDGLAHRDCMVRSKSTVLSRSPVGGCVSNEVERDTKH